MIKNVIKRDGRKVQFKMSKIEDAIANAILTTEGELEVDEKLLSYKVYENLREQFKDSNEIPTVECIQDLVEKTLLKEGLFDVAKTYIIHRRNRTNVRENNTKLMNIFKSISFADSKNSDIKRENANIDGDTAMGVMLKFGSEASKEFAMKFLLKKKHATAHEMGDIHIHDLDFYNLTATCCQIDLEKLFTGGFSTGHGFIREPQSIASYAFLACIAIQSNQNDQHGGQSIPAFDYYMAPGVRKSYIKHYKKNIEKVTSIFDRNYDFSLLNIAYEEAKPQMNNNQDVENKLSEILLKSFTNEQVKMILNFASEYAYKETDRETYQAMESLLHNLNTMHSRAGAQVPFSSINYGTDTSVEGRMVIKNMLLVTETGLGNNETPIFPIQIFKVKEGINFNEEDKNYDLFLQSCKVSAKRLFPNYAFIDATFNIEYYKEDDYRTQIAYMGCRTRVIGNVYKDNEVVTGRGNLSFTSINLPRLAIKANKDLNEFFYMLEKQMDSVIEQLYIRYQVQTKKHVYNYPFLMGQGNWTGSENLSNNDTLEEVLKHGSLSIGFIGLAETLTALTGKHHGECEKSQELGLKIISFMRNYLDKEAIKTNLNYSLLATPAEGLSGRFINKDKQEFGIIDGVTNQEYYTNSFHIPVDYKISIFKKIELEGKYHEYTNAGHITYVELDSEASKNIDAFVSIVKHMKESNVGYGSINHPLDRDPVCGFSGVIDDVCPKCNRKEDEIPFERIRRITGYLVGTLDRFNNAKLAEVKNRVKHEFNDKN